MSHKKKKARNYTFMWVPSDGKEARSIQIKSIWLRFLIAVLVIIGITLISGIVTYWKVASMASQYSTVKNENEMLKESLANLEEIKGDLNKIQKMDQKLRSSMSGYVKIVEKNENPDVDKIMQSPIFENPDYDEGVLYNSIPEVLPVEGFITRGIVADEKSKNIHLGIDIAAATGSPIKATADGVVLFSGYTIEEGNLVILKHKFNYYSFYKHNLQNTVQELEFVKKGQVIALLGGTGEISSGPHVHFEIWKDFRPVDPLVYIRDADKYLQ